MIVHWSAGAKAAGLVPAIRAGSTGQPNLCQHSLDIRPKNRLAVCNPSHQAQRVFLSVAKDLNLVNDLRLGPAAPLTPKGESIRTSEHSFEYQLITTHFG